MVGYNPTTLSELLKLLFENKDATIYAGGTDLMVTRKFQEVVLFINQVRELQKIEKKDNYLVLGATLTYDALLRSDVPEMMKRVFETIASPAIRNRGTIGGNICNASPAGDTLPMWYALSALVELQSLNDSGNVNVRTIPIQDFILGIRKLDRKPGEVLTAIKIPLSAFEKDTYLYHKKVGARRAEAISKLSIYGMARFESGRIEQMQVAFGAVGVTVVQPTEMLELTRGLTRAELMDKRKEIVDTCMTHVKPINDQRSTAEYRKTTVERLLDDFIDMVIDA